MGGEVIKAEQKGRGLGVQTWQIKNKTDWMKDSSLTSLSLNAGHQDQVIKLPEGGKLFAGSDFCPIAGFEVGSMLAFQGHPEFNNDYIHYLVDSYISELDPVSKEKTSESLKLIPHSEIVGACMVGFILHRAA